MHTPAAAVVAWAAWAAWICSWRLFTAQTVIAIKKERTSGPLFFFASINAGHHAHEALRLYVGASEIRMQNAIWLTIRKIA